MTISEYIAERLRIAGVRYVFGIPGGPSIPYMEAFRAEGIEFILVSNEASAGIMADVTARLSGIPGVCHATFGPGATNITTGVGEALLDRSPVIVFTSEMPDDMINRTTQMNIDHQRLFAPVTKATFRIDETNAAEVMNAAMKICLEEYPGPVHIGLPTGIASKEILPDNAGISSGRSAFHNDIQRVLMMLENSRRPLMAVGLSAARLVPAASLLEFLDKYRMPVVLTPMAKGIIPEDHPCYAGVLFHSLSDYLEDIYGKTDLVIGLGYDQVEFNYESWMPDVPLLHFDVRETDLPSLKNILRYTGPPDEWFTVLKNLNSGLLLFENALVKGIRDEMEAVFSGFTGHFGPASVLRILQEELPENVILTADVGSHLHLAGQFWKTIGKSRFLMTNGWSGMGFGIPAALAAQLYLPDATVVCITGDGGFLMMAGELVTARRYNLPVITVVFSDGELNLIKVKQSWKNLPPYGTILYQGDLFGSDRFFGIRVIQAASPDTMRSALIEALAVNEPVIINAVIDPEDYSWLIVKR
jgi:acetolactate synthase I/II/III large subunit